MRAIVVAETYSTPGRVEAGARRLGSAHHLVLADGSSKMVCDPRGSEEVVVVLPKGKAGERLFAPWEMSYVVPPSPQLEGLWSLVQDLVERGGMPLTFAGVVGDSFRWGWVEASFRGVSARGRLVVGQAGLVPEFYCAARSRGMSPGASRDLAVGSARQGLGATRFADGLQAQVAHPAPGKPGKQLGAGPRAR